MLEFAYTGEVIYLNLFHRLGRFLPESLSSKQFTLITLCDQSAGLTKHKENNLRRVEFCFKNLSLPIFSK